MATTPGTSHSGLILATKHLHILVNKPWVNLNIFHIRLDLHCFLKQQFPQECFPSRQFNHHTCLSNVLRLPMTTPANVGREIVV